MTCLTWRLPGDSFSKCGLLHLLHEPKPNALILWGHHVWNETQECKATHDRQSADRTHCSVTISAFHTVTRYDQTVQVHCSLFIILRNLLIRSSLHFNCHMLCTIVTLTHNTAVHRLLCLSLKHSIKQQYSTAPQPMASCAGSQNEHTFGMHSPFLPKCCT